MLRPFLPRPARGALLGKGPHSGNHRTRSIRTARPRAMAVEPLEDRRLLAAIHGQKWHDVNANAQHDPGETGLNGWTIELRDAKGALIATTTTADRDLNEDGLINPETESGLYSFEDLPGGNYVLGEELREGWAQSTIDPVVKLASDLDRGLHLYKINCGLQGWHGAEEKWVRSADQSQQWYFILSNGELYEWDNVSGSRLGSPLHGTLFAVLDPAYYTDLELLIQAPVPGSKVTPIDGDAEVSGVDFGNYQPGSIAGRKWHDTNSDGTWDPDEPPFDGWTIQLLDDRGQVAATAITGDADLNDDGQIDPASESGWYRFDDVTPGSYSVVEVSQPGWQQSGPGPDQLGMTLSSGQQLTGPDFGNYRPGSITGRKWHDLSGEGRWDRDEPALSGWTIQLLDDTGQVVATTVTADIDLNGDGQIDSASESGWYQFDHLKPGSYLVREVSQEGWRPSLPTEPASMVQVGVARDGVDGKTYTIADKFADGVAGQGTHFHASNEQPIDPVNSTIFAANRAEVGGLFGDEEIRGLVEFDLAAMPIAQHTLLTFQVADLSGDLNPQPVGGLLGQDKYVGSIDVVAYPGDGAEDLVDFQAPAFGLVGSFDTDSLSAGDTITLDITEIYNQQIKVGNSSLGIRLQISDASIIPDGAITFQNAHLQVADPVQVVEAPWGLFGSVRGVRERTDFGNYQPASIGGRVWDDGRAGGQGEAGESALSGWTIELLDGQGQLVASTTTGDIDADGDGQIDPGRESGRYGFEDVAPGVYTVRQADQDGWVPTTPGLASYRVTVVSGQSLQDLSFGNTELAVQIADVQPAPRAEPVERVQIVFSHPVEGFDLDDLQLLRTNDRTVGIVMSAATLASLDHTNWTLDNLSHMTSVAGTYALILDATEAGIVETSSGHALITGDAIRWINGPGDVDLDGIFNQLDVVQVLQIARYEAGPPASWSQGDWTGDDLFGEDDLDSVLQLGHYLQGPFGLPASSVETEVVDAELAELGADLG